MRTALVLIALAVAAPAAAQGVPSLQLDALRMEQQAGQQRMVDLQNQLMAQESQSRADRAAAQLQQQRELPARPPELRYDPASGAALPANPAYPITPDAALADSNRKVQDAARNRR